MIARFQERYAKEIVPTLMKQFNYKSVMQVPRVTKIVLNVGVGEAVNDKKVMDFVVDDLTKMSGQKPVVTLARNSIAGFKIREGWPIGCKVTLRKQRMYEYLDRLITIYIPRIRDFRGYTAKAFDGSGNYSLGIKEQIVAPEIDYDKIDAIRGMDITITTTARTDAEAKALMVAFGFPFK